MKRLLLLMGAETYRAPDFLAAARKLGVDLVVGTDAPSGGSRLSPLNNVVLPFQDADRAIASILERHRANPFDSVVSADEAGVVLAAKAGQALGLEGNPAESAVAAGNKAVFRDILRAAGLPGPWHREVEVGADPAWVAQQVTYPCVLKPLFLSASRGVIRADTPAEFAAAFARIAHILAHPDVALRGGALAGKVLVEGFISGPEVAVEGLLVDGELKLLALFDKPDPLDGPFFEETLYITPSRRPDAVQRAIVRAVEDAARALGLRTGPVHAEVRLGAAAGSQAPSSTAERLPRGASGTAERLPRGASGTAERLPRGASGTAERLPRGAGSTAERSRDEPLLTLAPRGAVPLHTFRALDGRNQQTGERDTSRSQTLAPLLHKVEKGRGHEERLCEAQTALRPMLVELAPRSIGGHCSRSLVFGAGMSLEELILRQALGLAPGPVEREGRASGVMMLPIPRAGVLRGVTGQDAALAVPGIEALEIAIRPGESLVPLPEGHRYLGFLFAKGTGPENVEAALRKAHGCLRFDIA